MIEKGESRATSPTLDLVHGSDWSGGLVFVPRSIAREHLAFQTAATWGEFRKVAPNLYRRALSALGYLDIDGEVAEGAPADEEGFDPSYLFENEITHSFYQLMFDFIPAEVGAKYGKAEASLMTGETLWLDGKHETAIAEALRAQGFSVERDQALIDALLA
jgi:hypothetical protein